MRINSIGKQSFGKIYPERKRVEYENILRNGPNADDYLSRLSEVAESNREHIWLEDNGDVCYKKESGDKKMIDVPTLSQLEKLKMALFALSDWNYTVKSSRPVQHTEQKDCPSSVNDLFPNGHHEHNPWFPLDD